MYKVVFYYNGTEYSFSGNLKKCLGEIINFLIDFNFKFDKTGLLNKPVDKSWILNNESYKKYIRGFFELKNSKFFWIGGNKLPIFNRIKNMLIDLGVDESTIKTEGFESESNSRIKKFGEMDNDNLEIDQEDTEESYTENPFKQSICVLGGSGVGKSVTIENILENEGHTFEYIIPTAATTGILAQFSPSKSTYVPSKLGSLLLQAANDPSNLYTAVFDEMHKSNVIEMINDELLQAISTKRNRGVRFISLDPDTAEMYQEMETKRGNIIIPDNFGFIFISSKPKVIANNPDFFNRVDIIILEEKDRNIDNSDELLDRIISNEEKSKLSSTRND